MTKIWPEKDVYLIFFFFGEVLLKLNLANMVKEYRRHEYGQLVEKWVAIYENKEDD